MPLGCHLYSLIYRCSGGPVPCSGTRTQPPVTTLVPFEMTLTYVYTLQILLFPSNITLRGQNLGDIISMCSTEPFPAASVTSDWVPHSIMTSIRTQAQTQIILVIKVGVRKVVVYESAVTRNKK